MIACNSLGWLPAAWRPGLLLADSVLLTMAMAAIGLHTRLDALRQSGAGPLRLAGALFVFLVLGGWLIHWAVTGALAS